MVNTGQTTPDILMMAQQRSVDRKNPEITGDAKKLDEEIPSHGYGHVLPIDEQKMKQLQEGILQVRVGMGMMSSGQSGGSGMEKGSAELKNENDRFAEPSEISNFKDKNSSRNDPIKNNESAQPKPVNSFHTTQSREKPSSASNAHVSAPGPSDDPSHEEADQNA